MKLRNCEFEFEYDTHFDEKRIYAISSDWITESIRSMLVQMGQNYSAFNVSRRNILQTFPSYIILNFTSFGGLAPCSLAFVAASAIISVVRN